jgi:hypothetical protein
MEKILNTELYKVAREGATETALQENIMNSMRKELITVQFVAIHYSFPLQNLQPHVAGLPFTSQYIKTV